MNEEILKNLVFADASTVIQPTNTVALVNEQKEGDHVLGGLLGPVWDKVLPGGNWLSTDWAVQEIQRVSDGDTYWCVTYSHNNNHRAIWKVQYSEDINFSERFPAIGAGTVRGYGIGKQALAEWVRTHGWLLQADCPTPNTLDLCYKPLLATDLYAGASNLKTTVIGYKYLGDASIASIKAGLEYSPVQVDVQNYTFNAKGYVVNTPGGAYVHEVDIWAIVDDYIVVKDSENNQFLKYDLSFIFGSPMIHSIKKADMTPAIKALEGKQVKSSSSGIYKIFQGQKCAYPDKLTFYCDGGLYGADGKTFVDVSDSLLNAIPAGDVVSIMNTLYWPQVSEQYALLKTLAEPNNLIELKQIIDTNKKITNTAAAPSLVASLLNLLTPHSATGAFGALTSSVDPSQLALTVKGLLVGLIPLALTYTTTAHPQLDSTSINDVIDALFTLGSACMVTWGVVRKLIVAYKAK